MTQKISYQDWRDFLLKVGAVCEPAELHGMVVGCICTQGPAGRDMWVSQAMGFMDLLEGEGGGELDVAMENFFDINLSHLTGENYQLQLLLPDDALPLSDRVDALAKWSQGFLHGIALGGGEGVGEKLDDESKDALRDIAQIAQASPQVDSDSNANEVRYAELVEYVRLAVFHLFSQLTDQLSTSSKSTFH